MGSPEFAAGRKVLLRRLAEADAAALREALEASRAELKRRFRWASAPQDAAVFIRAAAARNAAGRGLALAVAESRSGRLIGVAGLADRFLPGGGKARMSLWVRTERAGRGLATEACRLLADHGFRRLGLRRLHARIDPANRAGRKVLQKLGFRYEGCLREHKRLNGRWIDQECWGLLRTEWKKSSERRAPGP